ncbi:MAG: tetratricopeptide repeat protein [Planctomycetota bacterium]|jgi:tetratricopeptide (TPR) repeat protein
MILSSLILLSMQSGGLDSAVADASALAAKNNFGGAVQLLKDAGVEDSSDAAAWTAYGVLNGKLTENDIAAGRIQGLDAYDAWNDVAWIYEKASGFSGAEDVVWVNWSEALLNANDVPNSLRTVADGLSLHEGSALLLMQEGRVLMAMARSSAEMGEAEDAGKAYAKAEAAFQSAMEAAPETAAPCLRLGELLWTLFHQGGATDQAQHDAAIAAFKMAAKREPAGVDGGAVSAWLGEEGIPVLDILIEGQPEEVLHYWYRGSALYAAGPDNWTSTRDDFLKVLELNPQFTNAYYFLADGAMQRGTQLSNGGDQPTAEKAYSAAAKFWAMYLKDFGANYRATVGPQGAEGAADTMNWLAGKTSMDHGIILLEWATTTKPDHGDAWNNLAFFYRDTRQPEKSLKAYARAHDLKPKDPQVMNDYAVIYHYYLHTEDERARDLYKQAIARAKEMIDNGEVVTGDEARIDTALRDATNNLRKLDAGNRVNG